MKIEKVYVLQSGSSDFFHVVGADSSWNTIPTIDGEHWSHLGGHILSTWSHLNAEWPTLIPERKGCMCHMITFNNGEVVYT